MLSLRKWTLSLLALALIALGTVAHAVGLGNIQVQSGLGQPLNALIPLHGADLANLEPRCVNARLEAVDGGALMLPRATLLRTDTQATLRVSTHQSINEPAVKVIVNIGCGGTSVHREFALLLDPVPTTSPVQDAPAATPVALAAAPSATSPMATNTVTSAAANIAAPLLAFRRKSAPKAVAEAPVAMKKLSAEKKSKGPRLKLSAVQIVESAIVDDTAMLQLRLSPMLTLSNGLLALQSVAEPAVETARVSEVKTTTPEPAQANVKHVESETQSNRAAVEAIRNESLLWIRGLGVLLLTCLGAMCWLLWRMRDMHKAESAAAWNAFIGEDAMGATHTDEDAIAMETRRIAKPMTASKEALDAAGASWEAKDIPELSMSSAVHAAHPEDTDGNDLALLLKAEEISDAMELVEVWMALNDPAKVLDILKPYSESEHVDSPLPWICLLDVHRALGDRDKYEIISEKIRNTFNVNPEAWQPDNDASPPKTLGDFPHVVAKILSLWQSEDLLPYLEHLLRDNRTGEREGFDVPVYRDLLRLLAIAKKAERCADDRELSPEVMHILSATPRAEMPRIAAPASEPVPEPIPASTTRTAIRERPKYITPSYERTIRSRAASKRQSTPEQTPSAIQEGDVACGQPSLQLAATL